jgi:gas vesicle protein
MGFDLYSLGNYKTEDGKYFRNNVWWWRPLANFICEETNLIDDDDKRQWQQNSGHKVDSVLAKQIATQLKALIKNGKVSEAIKQNEEDIKEAEENNKFVQRCHDMLAEKVKRETKKDNLAPADYPKDDHDTWEWIQGKYSYGSSYPFNMENVEEFIKFCEECGDGFEIC